PTSSVCATCSTNVVATGGTWSAATDNGSVIRTNTVSGQPRSAGELLTPSLMRCLSALPRAEGQRDRLGADDVGRGDGDVQGQALAVGAARGDAVLVDDALDGHDAFDERLG